MNTDQRKPLRHTHVSANGKVWRTPVRSANGGEHLNMWLDSELQAALRAAAADAGLTVSQYVRQLLREWAQRRA